MRSGNLCAGMPRRVEFDDAVAVDEARVCDALCCFRLFGVRVASRQFALSEIGGRIKSAKLRNSDGPLRPVLVVR